MDMIDDIELDPEQLPTFEGERIRLFLRESPVASLSERTASRARDVAARLAAAAHELPELRSGEALGEYEVVRELGRGGQGVVYLGRHRKVGWRCALKVPRRGVAHRLLKEARLAAPLAHPHVVQVKDVQVDVPRPFLVMDYCPGGSLAERIGASPGGMTDLAQVRAIAEAVLDALSYAHAHGIVHRDVKPANILFDEAGRVRVCDFGIGTVRVTGREEAALAQSVAPSAAESVTRFAGTPRYMAPEQEDPSLRACGKIDGRADIFALGKVLYEMLTGTPPRTVRPVSRGKEFIPEAWDEFIFRCVEERPEARFADARAALAALKTLPVAPAPEAKKLAAERAARQAALDVPPARLEKTAPPLWIPSPSPEYAVERARRDGVEPATPDPHVIPLPSAPPPVPRSRHLTVVFIATFLAALGAQVSLQWSPELAGVIGLTALLTACAYMLLKGREKR